MRIVYFSNTHGQHRKLDLPDGELLICGGGISRFGREDEIIDFIRWFDSQKHFYKVFIPGNSDKALDPNYGDKKDISENLFDEIASFSLNRTNHYLENDIAEIEGHVIYGLPMKTIQSSEQGEAFTVPSGRIAAHYFHKIPTSTHILVTSYPPEGLLDYVPETRKKVGDKQLRAWVDHIKPDLLLTGGVYQARGVTFTDTTTVINGHVCDPDNSHLRPAWNLFYDMKTGKSKVWKETTPFKV